MSVVAEDRPAATALENDQAIEDNRLCIRFGARITSTRNLCHVTLAVFDMVFEERDA